jgi:PleD family two-component response regulator
MEQHILVVDDDPDVVAYLRRNLERIGFVLDVASDAEQVARRLEEHTPDLILLDVMMPEGNGFGVLRRLAAGRDTSTIPVIVLTAAGRTTDRVRALRLGADDYVVKPFDVRELVARMRTVLRRARQLRELSPLTGLAGNAGITAEIAARIAAQAESGAPPFAVAHVDIDNFKSFNDRYGFMRGDGVIVLCARCLTDTAAERRRPVFVGHVGGDDFVVVLDHRDVDDFCKDALVAWDRAIPDLYEPEDLAAGGVEVEDRLGVVRRFPPATLSMGVATSVAQPFSSAWEASAIASEMKEHAKRVAGSTYQVDRRRRSV